MGESLSAKGLVQHNAYWHTATSRGHEDASWSNSEKGLLCWLLTTHVDCPSMLYIIGRCPWSEFVSAFQRSDCAHSSWKILWKKFTHDSQAGKMIKWRTKWQPHNLINGNFCTWSSKVQNVRFQSLATFRNRDQANLLLNANKIILHPKVQTLNPHDAPQARQASQHSAQNQQCISPTSSTFFTFLPASPASPQLPPSGATSAATALWVFPAARTWTQETRSCLER
jgi:hypothetical protein